jgi:hypothetical protein
VNFEDGAVLIVNCMVGHGHRRSTCFAACPGQHGLATLLCIRLPLCLIWCIDGCNNESCDKNRVIPNEGFLVAGAALLQLSCPGQMLAEMPDIHANPRPLPAPPPPSLACRQPRTEASRLYMTRFLLVAGAWALPQPGRCWQRSQTLRAMPSC